MVTLVVYDPVNDRGSATPHRSEADALRSAAFLMMEHIENDDNLKEVRDEADALSEAEDYEGVADLYKRAVSESLEEDFYRYDISPFKHKVTLQWLIDGADAWLVANGEIVDFLYGDQLSSGVDALAEAAFTWNGCEVTWGETVQVAPYLRGCESGEERTTLDKLLEGGKIEGVA